MSDSAIIFLHSQKRGKLIIPSRVEIQFNMIALCTIYTHPRFKVESWLKANFISLCVLIISPRSLIVSPLRP